LFRGGESSERGIFHVVRGRVCRVFRVLCHPSRFRGWAGFFMLELVAFGFSVCINLVIIAAVKIKAEKR
jgi:hypothetical protein